MIRKASIDSLIESNFGGEVCDIVESIFNKVKIDSDVLSPTDKNEILEDLATLNKIASKNGTELVYTETNSLEKDIRNYFLSVLQANKKSNI